MPINFNRNIPYNTAVVLKIMNDIIINSQYPIYYHFRKNRTDVCASKGYTITYVNGHGHP